VGLGLVAFVQVESGKVAALVRRLEEETTPAALRNKLVVTFFEGLRDRYDENLIRMCRAFLREVKAMVKEGFDPTYFYEVPEVIEEVRGLGGGVIVPHPEQFWPILLADYDVDGYEVWNPQSRMFTEFLIRDVLRQNRHHKRSRRRLLVTMGDDCHMGEKTKPPERQDPEKASREIGVQPWTEPSIL
jgi:hypothetical protein